MWIIKVVFFVLITGVTTIFVLANREDVTVSMYPLSYVVEAPLYIVVIGSFAMGVVVYGIGSSFTKVGYEKMNSMNKRKIQALENEIEALKAEKKIKTSL